MIIIFHLLILIDLLILLFLKPKKTRLNGLETLFSVIYLAVMTKFAVSVGVGIAIAALGTAIGGLTIYGGDGSWFSISCKS